MIYAYLAYIFSTIKRENSVKLWLGFVATIHGAFRFLLTSQLLSNVVSAQN